MKKTVLLIVFILSFVHAADAQWYERSCGVTDLNNLTSEEFDCLWKKSHNEVGGGILLTIIGTSTIVAGIFIPDTGLGLYEGYVNELGKQLFMIAIGVAIDIVGILIWERGAHRKSQLKKSPHYENLNLESLNISPAIGVNQSNNTYNYGVTLSFTFKYSGIAAQLLFCSPYH